MNIVQLIRSLQLLQKSSGGVFIFLNFYICRQYRILIPQYITSSDISYNKNQEILERCLYDLGFREQLGNSYQKIILARYLMTSYWCIKYLDTIPYRHQFRYKESMMIPFSDSQILWVKYDSIDERQNGQKKWQKPHKLGFCMRWVFIMDYYRYRILRHHNIFTYPR